MNLRLPAPTWARLAVLPALALLVSAPARGDDHVHPQTTQARAPPRAPARGGLLLLSFLVPLPLPMALVAPPSASRPAPPAARATGQAPAAPAPRAPVAKRTTP